MVRVCCLGTLTRMRLVGGFLPQAKACWIRVVSKQHIHIVIDIDSTVQQRSTVKHSTAQHSTAQRALRCAAAV